MATVRSSPKKRSNAKTSPLIVRLDEPSKAALADAARLRQVSVSDYVRTVVVPQARRELRAARGQTIALTPDEQIAFWKALQEPPRLTTAQRNLGALMRGRP
jgi:uncharacterized protein (DUF1778 family)